MKIAIIGAGAMGGLFGARLTSAGEEVWLVDTAEETIRAISQNGLTLDDAAGVAVTRPQAVTQASSVGPADLIIVFVKAWATPAAAKAARDLLKADTAVLTLQNGCGNAEILAAELGSERIIAGTTSQGASLLRPGHVLHGGSGDTQIGEVTGHMSPRLAQIAGVLTGAGIPTRPVGDISPFIWGKLLVNAGINAVTALTRLANGQLAEFAETRELVAAAVQEAAAVAGAAGVTLPYPDPVAAVFSVAKATARNRSSMLQDVLAGRPTEVAAINGVIVREGERLGVPTPANRLLTSLVLALSKGQRAEP
ncbi:MAG TPA: 2-dehydropantoate 2-reductase [Selenomonadales bacterium]|nr:2-dehydropantoate 2-reductase [Selenomonadales bacterium]